LGPKSNRVNIAAWAPYPSAHSRSDASNVLLARAYVARTNHPNSSLGRSLGRSATAKSRSTSADQRGLRIDLWDVTPLRGAELRPRERP
jgi:hypothetical protein